MNGMGRVVTPKLREPRFWPATGTVDPDQLHKASKRRDPAPTLLAEERRHR